MLEPKENSDKISETSKKWPQFLLTISASVAVFTSGVHTGWPAPSLPKLLGGDYYYHVTNEEASYITIISCLGNLCGGFLGMAIVDRIGRKKTILLIALPQLTSFLLIALSYYVMELLYFARYIGGVGEGMSLTMVPLYIAEVADPNIRGILGTLVIATCMLGMLFVNLVGSYLSITVSALIFTIFPVIFLVLFSRMPESPYYLLMKNQKDGAETVLKSIRRKRNVSKELQILTDNVNRQMSESGTFKDIFTIDSNRKAFFIIIGLRLLQQCTGFSGFAYYIQVLLAQASSSVTPHIGATILLIVQLIVASMSMFLVDRWGRKPLLFYSTTGCCITLSIQAVYFWLKEHTEIDLTGFHWLPLVMMIFYVTSFFIGLSTVINILTSEIFSASVKPKTVSLVNAIFAFFMLVATKFYQVTADNFGLAVPYSCFSILSFFGIIYIYFCVPETKGKTLEEIQQYFKRVKKTVIEEKTASTTV